MALREVFHEGEIALQEQTGQRAAALRNGELVAERIIAGARPFLAAQRMIAMGAADEAGQIWASLRFGPPGFVRSDDDGAKVFVSTPPSGRSPDDPLGGPPRTAETVGLLAIELSSRRRLRVNGMVGATGENLFEIAVREAFPQCPKYIQRRHLAPATASTDPSPTERGELLDARREELTSRVDTAFVASTHVSRGLDVSHRGGPAGFIRVEGERTLRFPDYPGTGMFQTLGNISVDPRAGLALVDFAGGRILALSGTATIAFGAEDPAQPSLGTGRYWAFTVSRWIELALPSDLEWELLDRSPFNPPSTG